MTPMNLSLALLVMVKGTTIGVITDIDGRYTISIPADGILSFSYVGLKDKEEKVNGRTTIQHHYAD